MKKNILVMPIVLLLALAALPPLKAEGSPAFSLSPPVATVTAGQAFNLNIYIDPAGQNIDTVRANLSYPADLLEVQTYTKGAAFAYMSGENGYDNAAGTFTCGAGTPGGTTNGGIVATLSFRAKKTGEASVTLNNSSLILSEGEDKYGGRSTSAFFKIGAAATPSPSKTPSPTPKQSPKTSIPPATGTLAPSNEPDMEPLGEEVKSTATPQVKGVQQKAESHWYTPFKFWPAPLIIFLTLIAGAVWYSLYSSQKKN